MVPSMRSLKSIRGIVLTINKQFWHTFCIHKPLSDYQTTRENKIRLSCLLISELILIQIVKSFSYLKSPVKYLEVNSANTKDDFILILITYNTNKIFLGMLK